MPDTPNLVIFQFIGNTIQNAINAYVNPAASNLISNISPVVISCVSLYLCLMGYSIMTGAVSESFWTFFKTSIKIIFISAIALNVTTYNQYAVTTLQGLETGLAQTLNMQAPTSDSGGEAATIYTVLDNSFNQDMALVGQCMQQADDAGMTHMGSAMGWLVAALTTGLGALVLTGVGGAIIIGAQLFLALLFAVGPLFIIALIFPVTHRFFDAWLGQCLNYVFTTVFVVVILTFAMKAFNAFIAGADFSGDGNSDPLFVSLQILLLSIIFAWVLYQVGGFAGALAGGVSMAAIGVRHLAAPFTGTAGALRQAGNAINPTSVRRDLTTGMMASGSRMEHLMAGNTVLNPAYRQALRENLGRNWGSSRGGSMGEAKIQRMEAPAPTPPPKN